MVILAKDKQSGMFSFSMNQYVYVTINKTYLLGCFAVEVKFTFAAQVYKIYMGCGSIKNKTEM